MSVHNHLAPYELVGMPFYVWLADVASDGTIVAKPDLDTAPPADWTMLGESGDENIVADGVKVTCAQTFKEHKPPSRLTPTRVFRTGEHVMVDLMLADMRAEIWQLILGGNSITSTAAAVGTQERKSIALRRGFGVPGYSLLIRGAGSPYYGTDEDYATEFWLPACYYSGDAAQMTGRLDDGAIALPMQFKSLEAKVQTGVVAADVLGRLEFGSAAPA